MGGAGGGAGGGEGGGAGGWSRGVGQVVEQESGAGVESWDKIIKDN